MTPRDVDRIAGDNLLLRHFLFIRYVLGESSIMVAYWLAINAAKEGLPLTVRDMAYVDANWHEDDDDG